VRRPALGAIVFALALALAFWWQERQKTPPSEAPAPQGDLRPPPPVPRPAPTAAENAEDLNPNRGAAPGSNAVEAARSSDAAAEDSGREGPGASGGPIPAGQPIAELPNNEPGRSPKHLWKADAPGIRGAVQESLPELKECYEEWQKNAPGLRGKVAVSFRIHAALDLDAGSAPEARVDQVRIGESELDHVFMEGCVSSVFSELRFAPPEGGKLEVTYPIQFESTEPPPP
jgi:hypothetical protein